MKALFGGSFNPVHIGHLIVARDILETFGFEEIIFVPAYLQPLKDKLFLPPELRLELLRISIEEEKGFSIWDYEIRKKGISYTVDTLREFWKIYKEKPIFIIGEDSFESFHLWKEPTEILKLAKIIVVKRPRYKIDVDKIAKKIGYSIKFSEVDKEKSVDSNVLNDIDILIYNGRLVEISSTEIRNRLKSNKSIRYLLPDKAEKSLRRWWKNAF
ncbi:nicotinate-nucleotide adenylyltransferase [Desulfurobacterium thermolithotrophum DSM 11699]|uniref:Probable nicotinate-nucleotide adenylyltransferase n=1 Tax=Desulfurobacterium thermolithotrophum (strain DSM 11699 / BSA) TaxID=868864 RepID=F0S0X8_DESTD|nr:nicotinate (nicotinamide) nucleotide adenylyltransferase [Desulfurobacterium thermolithotrophum]ADY72782.1 nicotinate-nucleotide adenylyltransferase [Desulfurobacterium thermolithotrophum DSM 11699]